MIQACSRVFCNAVRQDLRPPRLILSGILLTEHRFCNQNGGYIRLICKKNGELPLRLIDTLVFRPEVSHVPSVAVSVGGAGVGVTVGAGVAVGAGVGVAVGSGVGVAIAAGGVLGLYFTVIPIAL